MKRRSKPGVTNPAPSFVQKPGPSGSARWRRRWLLGTTCLVSLIALEPRLAQAGPDGASVVSGSATVTNPTAQSTLITQTTSKAIINWRGFSSAANESIVFQQPGASSIALNRVTGGQASTLLGSLSANGQVWLVNPNGVFFGQGATVNVGGLLATTSDIRDQDFLAGNYSFGTASPNISARIVNLGTIEAAEGGTVVLSAPTVENAGVIKARLGSVVLGGSQTFTVDFVGDGLLSYAIGEGVGLGSGVKNSGSVIADGGTVLVTAKAATNITDALINTTGLIQANTVSEKNGTIILDAGESGLVVDGRLSAVGDEVGEKGGTIKALGGTTHVADGAVLDASGQAGGGFVETSGHRLSVGRATIRAGTWLLDPYDLTIDASAAATISAALGTNTDVTVQTTASGASGTGSVSEGTGDIVVNADIGWSSAATFTLDAYHDIHVNAVISHTLDAMNNYTPGGLRLIYGNVSGSGSSSSGTYHIGSSGRIRLAGSDDILEIGGNGYTVVTDWNGLISGINGYYAVADNIAAGSGQISVEAGAVLAGLGNTIALSGMRYTGLVDENNGTIRDVRLTGAQIIASGSTGTGALVDRNYGTILASSASGTVTAWGGTSKVGGLVGQNIGGTVLDSSATVTISAASGSSEIGGLVGWNNAGGSVGASSASATITAGSGSYAVGGLVGRNDGTLANVTSAGTIVAGASSDMVGGLVGSNYSTVSSASSSASVSGATQVGGLVGRNNGTIQSSRASGTVAASDVNPMVGGLVGRNDGTIASSSATGAVAGTVTGGGGSVGDIGGLVGYNSGGSITGSYATGAVSGSGGKVLAGGLVGLNDDSGTITDDLATGAVSASGAGSYAGGLVGQNDTGSVSASFATGAVTNAGGAAAGGLVGLNSNNGIIEQTFATGAVTNQSGAGAVGGLVGENNGSSIADSYAIGAVKGGAQAVAVGGLVGRDVNGSIDASYSIGVVTSANGTANVGGLVGEASGSTITTSYWDTVTSGRSTSAGGGEGLTTATFATLLDQDQGFILNSDRWFMGDGGVYPILRHWNGYVTVTVNSATGTVGSGQYKADYSVSCGGDMSCGLVTSGLVASSTAGSTSAAGSYSYLLGGTVGTSSWPAYQINLVPGTLVLSNTPDLTSPAATQSLNALIAQPNIPTVQTIGPAALLVMPPPQSPPPPPPSSGQANPGGAGTAQATEENDAGVALFHEISPDSNVNGIASGGTAMPGAPQDPALRAFASPPPAPPAPLPRPAPVQINTQLAPGLAQSGLGVAPQPPFPGIPGIGTSFSASGNSGRW